MASTGIRELRDRLSHFIRQVEAGGRVAVTAHGRVVAQLVPPAGRSGARARYDELVARGAIEPAADGSASPMLWPDIRMPPGTVAGLIAGDRGES
jgi:prevent-host-death family protein